MSSRRNVKKNKWLFGGLLALVIFVYASGCAYMWVYQKYYIFMPQQALSQTPADQNLKFEDIYLPIVSDNGDGVERIHCWWIPTDQPTGRHLIYLHGGAYNIGANISHARRFKDMGFSVLLVSYRGYGRSEGNFPTERQVYMDADTAWNYLVKKRGLPPDQIYIYGHSLGGAVAINLAVAHPEAAALIVEATFTSIGDMGRRNRWYRLLPIELITHQRFDSIDKMDRLDMPVLILHGTEDQVVPCEMGRQLYEKAPYPKKLKLILGGGHSNSARVGGEEYLSTVKKFIDEVQKGT